MNCWNQINLQQQQQQQIASRNQSKKTKPDWEKTRKAQTLHQPEDLASKETKETSSYI